MMPGPAADPTPRTPKLLAGLAGLACVACCLLPLITAGVVGAGAGALVGWLPTIAAALATLAADTWWLGQQRRRAGACKLRQDHRARGWQMLLAWTGDPVQRPRRSCLRASQR